MKTSTILAYALAFTGMGLTLAATPDAPAAGNGPRAIKIRKMSIQIVFDQTETMRNPRGTYVWLELTAPIGKRFIEGKSDFGMLRREHKLDCKDGAGNSLRDAELQKFYNEISKDGGTMCVRVHTPSLSPDGVLALSGKIPATLSTGKEEQGSAPLTLEEGKQVSVAGYEVAVTEVHDEGPSLMVGFSLKGKAEPAGISFRTKDGRELEADNYTRSVTSGPDSMDAEYSYHFEEKPEEVQVVISQWGGTEEIRVPVKTRVRLDGTKGE